MHTLTLALALLTGSLGCTAATPPALPAPIATATPEVGRPGNPNEPWKVTATAETRAVAMPPPAATASPEALRATPPPGTPLGLIGRVTYAESSTAGSYWELAAVTTDRLTEPLAAVAVLRVPADRTIPVGACLSIVGERIGSMNGLPTVAAYGHTRVLCDVRPPDPPA